MVHGSRFNNGFIGYGNSTIWLTMVKQPSFYHGSTISLTIVNHGWTIPKKHGYNYGTFLVGLCHHYVDPASIYRILSFLCQIRPDPDPNRIQIHWTWLDPDPSRIHQIHRISGQIRIRIWIWCTPSSQEFVLEGALTGTPLGEGAPRPLNTRAVSLLSKVLGRKKIKKFGTIFC